MLAHVGPYLCIVKQKQPIMATISSTDRIFASAWQRGREIFNACGDGFSGFADIVSQLRRGGNAPGMVTLTVRNSSQGWTRTSSIYLR